MRDWPPGLMGLMGLMGQMALLCALSPAAAAQPAWEAGLAAGVDHLDAGRPAWRERAADLQWRGPALRAQAGLREAERYGLSDVEGAASIAAPIGPALSAGLSLAAARGRFLPWRSLGAELAWSVQPGWSLQLRARRQWLRPADAPTSAVSLAGLDLEHDTGPWRVAGGLAQSRLDGGGGQALAGRLQLDRYLADRHRIGLVLAGGQEIEATPGGPLRTRVRSATLLLRADLGTGWALDLNLARHWSRARPAAEGQAARAERQRDGVALGVRRRF